MMSADLEALADLACIAEFGERFRFEPMTAQPSSRPARDTSRPAGECDGLFRAPGSVGGLAASREGMESGKGVGVQGVEAAVSIRQASLPYRPRKHDRVVRVSNGQAYSVVRVAPFGADNMLLVLSEVAP